MSPVIYTLTARHEFAASHVLDGHPLCGKMHGHTFRVALTIMGDPNPEVSNMIADETKLDADLEEALGELRNRHLNDMLPTVIPSAQGVAAWLWERFALHYKMYEVTVWQEDLSVTVRRDR